jgi:hypothetical protein
VRVAASCMYEIALHGVCHVNNLLGGELSCQHISIASEQSMHAMLPGPMHGSFINVQSVLRWICIDRFSKTVIRRDTPR